MHAQQIVVADYLDLLFENKNKEYGAYPLRKGYNKRFFLSLLLTGVSIGCALALYYIKPGNAAGKMVKRTDVEILLTERPEIEQPDVVIPKPPVPPPQQATVRHLVPVIVADEDADPEDAPPPVDNIEHAKIGNITQSGTMDDGITAPPINDHKGIIDIPRSADEEDKIFIRVEVESSYPGGPNAWRRFLMKTLLYPESAQQEFVQGNVVVRFVVDKEGNVSNVEAISGPEELRMEAVRVISKSGRWEPAVQNGRKVKSYKQQGIAFRLE